MLEILSLNCERTDCDRPLTEENCMLFYQTESGERRAYECSCGAVTVTVTK
jgi:hypothetical protein